MLLDVFKEVESAQKSDDNAGMSYFCYNASNRNNLEGIERAEQIIIKLLRFDYKKNKIIQSAIQLNPKFISEHTQVLQPILEINGFVNET